MRFASDLPVDSLVPRADQCGFCRKHNAAVISDAAGRLAVTIADAAGPPYRFGLMITDFHICRRCGVFVAATGACEDGLRGVVNVHALFDRERFSQPPVAVRFDGKGVAERQARRRHRWTVASVAFANVGRSDDRA